MRHLVWSWAALVVMASVACSQSSGSEGTTEDDATSIPRTDPAPTQGDPGATPVAPSAPAPAGDAGTGEGGGGGDGGGGGAGDGGGGANPLCAPGSIHETEANDSADTANVLPNATSSFCGTLSSATDADFVSFVLPADTKTIGFGAELSAKGVSIEGTAGGQTFNVGGTPAFEPGQKYVFEIHGSSGEPVRYRFDVTIGK
jgi:hypothetical protein